MRSIKLHRRAQSYLSRMPARRREQVAKTLKEVAAEEEILAHPRVSALGGNLHGSYRLRVGTYRVVFVVQSEDNSEVIYVENVGPRGDAYR